MFACTRSPIDLGGSTPPAFSPDDIPTILQNLGSPLSYAASPLGNVPVLESSVGEVGTPRGQACVALDGSNDCATRTDAALCLTGDMTISIHIKSSDTTATLMGCADSGSNNTYYSLYCTSTTIQWWQDANASALTVTASVLDGNPHHIAATRTGSAGAWVLTIYVDGTQVGQTTSSRNVTATGTQAFSIGQWGAYVSSTNLTGFAWDARVYSTAKSDAEILAISNQHLTPDEVDTTNALGIWPLQEEDGTVCYNIVDPTKNLTATNVDTSTFRTTDSGVKFSFPNQFGYTDDAGVIIPADLSAPTLDCEGDALETPGPIWLPGVMEVPCITVTGTEYLALAHLTGSETVVSKVGTSTASVAAGRINLTAGTISSIVLSDGTTLPCQEGPGPSNTNRTVHNVDGTARHATLTNGAVSSLWAARLATVEDWCIKYGGGIAANGSFVPGISGSANDAAGNAKTLAVGKRGNPYSKLLRNYFSAPALVNIGCTSSDKEAPGYDVQSESVANTRFRRTAADGDDRDLSFSEAQTGETLANIEEWTQ